MERKIKKIHPGQILHMELVEGKNLTISKIAELLGTTRSNFSNIINGHTSISPNMVVKIRKSIWKYCESFTQFAKIV